VLNAAHSDYRARLVGCSLPSQARLLHSEGPPHGMCLDQGYDDDTGRALLTGFGCTAHLSARGAEAKALKEKAGLKARRWVVERTPNWMNRSRRVLIRWDKKVRNYIGLLHLVYAYITYRQAGLLG
jgi:putative transposase